MGNRARRLKSKKLPIPSSRSRESACKFSRSIRNRHSLAQNLVPITIVTGAKRLAGERLRGIASLRVPITLITIAGVFLAPLGAPHSEELTRATIDACQARDDAGLRTAVVGIGTDALERATKTLDYKALVGDQWRQRNLDQLLDSRVDIAVEEVKNETSWTERLQSLTNAEQAQKLATSVAERVYRSDAVKTAIEDLASGVATEVGKTIEFASSDASGPLLDCLKAFVGPRYGASVAQALTGEAGKDLVIDPKRGSGDVSATSVLKETGGGLAGATILIVRRQLANLAARVGQRIVGSILSRLVSVVAGGVGLVLIAKDIWDFRNGVLPIIATEMKSPATKEKVRDELAKTLSQQMNDHIKGIAATTADNVVGLWQTFKRAHALVLRLADDNASFRSFLDGVKPEAIPRLDEVVSIIVSSEGESSILNRLKDGSLNTAVHTMPEKGLEIARDTKSVASGLDWSTLAGDKLDRVVAFELHKRVKPDDLTKAELERILALDDRSAIVRIASVPAKARDTLFGVSNTDLPALIRSLSADELTSLAGYLNGLQSVPREKVLQAVAADPSKMQVLAAASVRERIIASNDQSAAAEMMLKPSSGLSPRQFADDVKIVWEGRVAPLLLWEKHPQGVVAAGLLALCILLWLARLIRPRRQPPSPAASS